MYTNAIFTIDAACLCALRNEVFLKRTDKLLLLRRSLEGAMTKFAAGVDPFDFDLFESATRSMDKHGLAQGHYSLLHTGNGAFEKNEIVLDNAISNESAHPKIG